MAKSVSRNGVKIFKDGDGKGTEFWRVRLGKKFTGVAAIRKSFRTQAEANKFVQDQEAPKILHGSSYFTLTPKQLADAREALEVLTDETSLVAAAAYWKRHARPAGGIKTFAEIRTEFYRSREASGCKKTTLRQYKSSLNIICETFGEKKLSELRPETIEEWLAESEWEPKTRRNYLTDMNAVLNWAVSRKYCAENPAASIPKPKLTDITPGILTPEQAKTLLQAAASCMPEMIPGIALGLFAGLRRSEICALNWGNIRFRYVIKNAEFPNGQTLEKLPSTGTHSVVSYGSIEISGVVAKNRQRRTVPMCPNLRTWLMPFRKETGQVAPDLDAYGEKLKHLVRGRPATPNDPGRPAVVEPWPHNALRHSFGSYRLALTQDQNLVALEMGNSPAMIHSHYKDLVEEPALSQYWAIVPPAGAKSSRRGQKASQP
ncbi:MAG: phage integrase N-terminal SAM-like domain-containing protein [Methylacidiphilales bacterium]|nr:phage integrase N-terminal SAM-like domain-containing protein [Candidatus Methylacidiphilales bacterium]